MIEIRPKLITNIRNDILINVGFPALMSRGFRKAPFATSWNGRNDFGGYSYEMCRLKEDSILEILFIDIVPRDRWIQCSLNIFKLISPLSKLDDLQGRDGLAYRLPPNSLSEMRFNVDDISGPPILSIRALSNRHKLKSFRTEKGMIKQKRRLSKNIKEDFLEVDQFILRWHKMYQVNRVNWIGTPIIRI